MTSIQIFVFDQNNNLVASRPDFEGNSQLEGGLLSAIFSFSNTIDEKEINSINFAEYSISFYKKEKLSLAFKTSRELSEGMTKEFFEIVKKLFDNMIKDNIPDPISVDLALEAVIDKLEKRYPNCVKRPIKNNKPYYFVIEHDEDGEGWKIINKSELSPIMAQIGFVINKHRKYMIPDIIGEKINSLFYLKEAESGVFATCEFNENKTEVLYVTIADEQFNDLLSVKDRYDKILRINQEKPLLQVFGMIQKSLICNLASNLKEDDISLVLLKDLIKKRRHLAINIFVTNTKVIVVGEKTNVYSTINTLRFFNQNLNASTNYWLEDVRGINKDTVMGMSVQKYQSIEELKIDIGNISVIELKEGKVKSTCPIKDTYFMDFIDDGNLTLSNVQSQLMLLNDVIKSILILSSHSKKEIKQKIEEYKDIYNKSLINYGLLIAKKMNLFLEPIIEEII